MARQRFPYLSLVLVFFLATWLLFRYTPIHVLLTHLGNLGYVGAFFAGMLFVSLFTVSIGAALLLTFSEYLHPLPLGIIASFGAVVGDLIIFRLVRTSLQKELGSLYRSIDRTQRLKKLLRRKKYRWVVPILAAIVIASPLPDEIGVSMLGLSAFRLHHFFWMTFILNAVGIFLLLGARAIVT